MKSVAGLVLGTVAFLAIANLNLANAQPDKASQAAAPVDQRMASSGRQFPQTSQEVVVCTGWHALCTASPDCKVNGDKANCDCFAVNETHIVMTAEIQDVAVKRLTEVKCTNHHPCDVDEAPVCKAIADGMYPIDGVKYDWVSTYSYRGWCSLLPKITACDPRARNYSGDVRWAICDAAPCTANPNPSNPEKPLTCQCRVVENTPFVGMNGTCTGEHGGIMSSMSLSLWDFENQTYAVPVPGYEYVQGACAALSSDR